MPLVVDIVRSHHVIVVRCRGRLVFGDRADLFADAARSILARGSVVALDLSEVAQIDARGAGILADLCAAAMRNGCALGVSGVGDRVRRVLRLTRLDAVMPDWSDTFDVGHRERTALVTA